MSSYRRRLVRIACWLASLRTNINEEGNAYLHLAAQVESEII